MALCTTWPRSARWMGRGGGRPVQRGMGATRREIGAGAAQDGARRRGRQRTAHRDCCRRMRNGRGTAGGQRDESGSGREWRKYLGVEERTLPVTPNRYAGRETRASEQTRPDGRPHRSIHMQIDGH
jgi:hypothetical protein